MQVSKAREGLKFKISNSEKIAKYWSKQYINCQRYILIVTVIF
jgi:hypothetical protein